VRNWQNLPVFMANPPPSAISNRNPPRKIGTYSGECGKLLAIDLHINNANAYEESLAGLIHAGCLASVA
jgi:hypothetical protein